MVKRWRTRVRFDYSTVEAAPMTEHVRRALEVARTLSPGERELAESILDGLPDDDPDVNTAWAKEAGRRLDGYLKGDIEAYDADEVFAEIAKQV
jgi:Putative addiction module component